MARSEVVYHFEFYGQARSMSTYTLGNVPVPRDYQDMFNEISLAKTKCASLFSTADEYWQFLLATDCPLRFEKYVWKIINKNRLQMGYEQWCLLKVVAGHLAEFWLCEHNFYQCLNEIRTMWEEIMDEIEM